MTKEQPQHAVRYAQKAISRKDQLKTESTMTRSCWLDARGEDSPPEVLWEDGDRTFFRISRNGADGAPHACIAVLPAAECPTSGSISRLANEYGLKEFIESAWALRPLELVRQHGRTALVLEYRDGEPLDRLIGRPMEIGRFLRLAVALAGSLMRLHERGLVHKDIKPANILVDASDRIWLTGFGVASRLPREHQSPEPPEFISGTLSHMAPEQTGRMNRSIDSRSDLYSLGVTLYQTLTGSLPFTATDPMEWVHRHVARQPVPPKERRGDIPSQVSALVMKLLAKTPEERYQTAAGVERDLRRCLADWERRGAIDEFPLGARDRPGRLLILERLYGRQKEIDALLASFDRVVGSGMPQLVLVSGRPGIGKSAVVNELHKVLVPRRGLFASGKFDQLKRDVPYATLAQAFQKLIRFLLGKPEAELRKWRDDLRQALDPNGALVVELIPELKFVLGEQPPVPDVPSPAAKARFQLALRRLIGVFARPEHPLALFLDDLQWFDAATLDLLEDVFVQPEPQHLLMVGAYRDNEVDPAHPLIRKLGTIRKMGLPVQEIALAPLNREDLAELIADGLHDESQRTMPLAQLVHEKTAGNPFFANQFLQELVAEELISFDPGDARWLWDLGRIRAKGYTDNVVDLMVGKLSRLPATTQEALKELACLGNLTGTSTLAIVHGTSEEELHSDLWEALRLGLIVRSESSYLFVHDRVQEAAYSLIPGEIRAEAHLRIGRLLTTHLEPDKREDAIFEIVGHLNRGSALIASQDEREQLASLNLTAGKRAKAAGAYASALNYLIAGVALVPKDGWGRRHDLIFELELNRAECEFLTGEMASAEEHFRMLSSHAADAVQRAAVACRVVDVYWALRRPDRGLAECLECLRHAGLDIPIHPTEAQARTAYGQICSKLDGVGIDEVAERPLMTDPTSRAILNVLAKALPCAVTADKNLVSLMVCAAVDISLERGDCDSSCFAYEYLGFIAGWKFGDFKAAFRFGRLGHELVERKGLRAFEGFVGLIFSSRVMPWARHIASCRELVRNTFDVANKTGDRASAVASRGELVSNLLFAGEPLVEAEKEAEVGLEFCRRAAFSDYIDRANTQAAFIRNLRGLTRLFGSLDDERFAELRMENHFESQPHLLACECWYWVRRLQARFFAGDYAAALDASIRAQGLLSESPGALELVEYELYSALTHAAVCDSASPDERRRHLHAMAAHLRQIELWARHCPENFENRAALVAAEIARIEARDLDAMRLYEQAIRSTRDNGFVHIEALAAELAAHFYATRGFDRIATAYMRDARHGYLRWGAQGKVRQLDERYPHLRDEDPRPDPTHTVQTPVEHLDLATVLKVSQAVSSETDLQKLIATVMRLGLEHAGAGRGLLILPRGDAYRIEAEAKIGSDAVSVDLRQTRITAEDLPESVFHYVLRTREGVLLQDASVESPFSDDDYIQRRRARSVLCTPLLKQTRLVGVIYLENNLTAGVFTPTRMALLKLLASEAAISLENARLYSDLHEREEALAETQHLSSIGTFSWRVSTDEITWSEQLYRIYELEIEVPVTLELIRTRVHPEDVSLFEKMKMVEQARDGGGDFEWQYRLMMPDHSIKYLHAVARATRDQNGQVEYMAAVQDVTDRKLAEEALNRARSELAHMARVTTLSALTASIAHEVNQPIAAITASAGACLRWLNRDQPDVQRAREAALRIEEDGKRAAEIITHLKSFYKKDVPPQREMVSVNDVVGEMLVLLRSEADRHSVVMRPELAVALPWVSADRVQLQQVLMNLMLNGMEAMSQRGGELKISTRREGGDVMVSVSDTGVGIPADQMEDIFNAFVTTKAGGTGMGLAISRTIMESHGGRLWATANRRGGATFHFTLPTDPEA